MAIITSAANGLWSAAATWTPAQVPVNGDTVTVATGHVVTYDVDMSAFAVGVALTINGTLDASRVVNSYLKVNAVIAGSGIYSAGSQAAPLPRSVTHTCDKGAGSNYIGNLGSLQWWCNQPAAVPGQSSPGVVPLSAAVAVGATVLPVVADVSADYLPGMTVIIVGSVPGSTLSETRGVASVSSAAITLTTGVGTAWQTGSLVALRTRNVRSVGGTSYHVSAGNASYVIGAELVGCTYGVATGVGHTISGTISGCTTGVIGGSGNTLSGTILGCTNGVNAGAGHTISGTISGCTNGVNAGAGHTISGTISGCTNGVYLSRVTFAGGTISGGTYALRSAALCYGMHFIGNTIDVATFDLSIGEYVDSRVHNGVAGDRRTWTTGGTVTTDAATPTPDGKPSRLMSMTSVSGLAHIDDPVTLDPGQRLIVTGWIRRADLTATVVPRIQIVAAGADPLTMPGAVPLVEQVASGAVGVWQPVMVSYTAPAGAHTQVIVRFVGAGAASVARAQVNVTPQPVRVWDGTVWKSSQLSRYDGTNYVPAG